MSKRTVLTLLFFQIIIDVIRFAAIVIAQHGNDRSAQQEQADQVRNNHDAVEEVNQLPYQIDFQQAAQEDKGDNKNLIRTQAFFTEQIADIGLTEIVPADNR